MASSLREQLLARLAAILSPQATGAVTCSRSREISINRDATPAIVIMPSGTEISRLGAANDKHGHEFSIEIFVRGDVWDSLADPVDVAAHALILADLRSQGAGALGTFVQDVERVGEAFEAQEADRTAGTLTVRFRATWLASKFAIDRAWP